MQMDINLGSQQYGSRDIQRDTSSRDGFGSHRYIKIIETCAIRDYFNIVYRDLLQRPLMFLGMSSLRHYSEGIMEGMDCQRGLVSDTSFVIYHLRNVDYFLYVLVFQSVNVNNNSDLIFCHDLMILFRQRIPFL